MAHTHLFGGEQAFGSEPAVAAFQIEGLPDMSNLLEVERCILPVSSALSVQNLCNLAITVLVQEPVDLGDDFRLCLPYLGNWQLLSHRETSSGAAAEAHMNLYLLTIDQRHILN